MPAQTVIKIRRDTSTNWSSVNPILAAGEIAFETDTDKIKVGDGSSTWSQLDYASGAGTAAEITADTTNFDGLLSGSDTTVQSALETLDDFEIPPGTTTSVSPPATPEAGQLWWNSETGTLFIYYDSFWVEAAPQLAGPAGADGEAFNNVDGGEPGTNYTGIEPIDAGGV
jgi:hypothetical protein